MIEWAQMATIISKKARKNHYHQYKRSLIILRVQVRRNKWPKNWREWKWTVALDLIWHIYRIKQNCKYTINLSKMRIKDKKSILTNFKLTNSQAYFKRTCKTTTKMIYNFKIHNLNIKNHLRNKIKFFDTRSKKKNPSKKGSLKHQKKVPLQKTL